MEDSYSETSMSVENEVEICPGKETESINEHDEVERNNDEKNNEEMISSQNSGVSEESIEENTSVDHEIVSAISNGFLLRVLPDLQQSKRILEELMRNQQVLIETVEQENSKFNECHSFQELEETMKQVRLYHSKLLSLKREMSGLHEKSAKLKKRAVKLQQLKQRDELRRAHRRDKEIEREKMLEAKPARRQQATPTIDTDTSAQPQNSPHDT